MDESLIEKQNGNFANTVLGAVPSVVYNEDCVEGLKRFSDNHFDLAIVDPPYGIEATKLKIRANDKTKQWDSKIPDGDYFKELFRVSKNQIIWGMNFLNDHLGRCDKTIIWDKQNDGTFGSDYELAWTSFDGNKQEIFRLMWYGYFYLLLSTGGVIKVS